MIGQVEARDCLYTLSMPIVPTPQFTYNNSILFVNSAFVPTFDLWYFRLDHLSQDKMHVIHKQFAFVSCTKNKIYDICHFAKQKCLPYPISHSLSSRPFDLIHMDTWDTFSIASMLGHKYFLGVVDDYSRHSYVFLMKNKFQTQSLVHSFVSLIENQFNTRIKVIRTDN